MRLRGTICVLGVSLVPAWAQVTLGLFGEGEEVLGCVDQGRVAGRGGSCSGGWRAEMRVRAAKEKAPHLKLGAALCT